jgi:hypothetical protein
MIMTARLPLRIARANASLIHARLAVARSAYAASISGVRPRLLLLSITWRVTNRTSP